MAAPDTLQRRTFIGLAAGGALSARMKVSFEPALATSPMADGDHSSSASRSASLTLEVAGPRDGSLAALACRVAGPLAAGLRRRGTLNVRFRGGVDGVTAANQFDARAMPDGQSALLLPGSVLLAWLLDDQHVRLDPAGVVPLMGAFGPGVLMVRDGTGALGTRPVRLAIGRRPDGALTALLGLDLLGVPAIAVPCRAGDPLDPAGKEAVNAVFVHGPEAGSRAAVLAQAGYRPALSTAPDSYSRLTLPGFDAPYFLSHQSHARGADDRLVEAWRAMAAATNLCGALVIPRLTPADAISCWREGVCDSLRDKAVAELAASQGVRLATDVSASTCLAPMQVKQDVQRALRGWLSARQIG